ncbi:hypothetical protein ACIBEK_07590 [Nocardia fusca]|uniref:hypothetical protein n=1 Tax=Nocardia fusca TaxID=941183 RepID=UPI0037B8C250
MSHFLQPADRDWANVGLHFTPEATAALATACGDAEPNTALRTSTNAACADELISVADSAETTTGKPAFAISTIAAPTPATRLSFS